MSFSDRLVELDSILTTLEAATPFILTQDTPPTQKDWEDAWVLAGNALPIPATEDLYWYDSVRLRGEFKALEDSFSLLSRSKTLGFEIRDIAGWEDNEHILVFVVREDAAGPQGACRMYMDGTLEQLSFTGFSPDGLLGYEPVGGLLWYYEGAVVKYIDVNTETITSVGTANSATSADLPEWRFFILVDDGSNDAFFGMQRAADPNRSLYFWDDSTTTLTRLMTTFNPGTGATTPDRPLALTTDYIFLSETNSRAGFDGNLIHQIARSGWAYDDTVDADASITNEVHLVPFNADYDGNTIDFMVTHVLGEIPPSHWTKYSQWDADLSTVSEVADIPHKFMIDTFRDNVNDHGLSYHIRTRPYLNNSFTIDGGDEVHYHSFSGAIVSPNGDKYILHDQGFHAWSETDSPDIYIYGTKTDKVYRLSEWEQYGEDVITLAQLTMQTVGTIELISIDDIPNGYGLLEVIHEVYNNPSPTMDNVVINTGTNLESGVRTATGTSTANISVTGQAADVLTDGSAQHFYVIVDNKFGSVQLRAFGVLHGTTTSLGWNRYLCEFAYFTEDFTAINARGGTSPCRWTLRAWRTEPRNIHQGGGYDPHMA